MIHKCSCGIPQHECDRDVGLDEDSKAHEDRVDARIEAAIDRCAGMRPDEFERLAEEALLQAGWSEAAIIAAMGHRVKA
jgi:hypothetical protein